MKFLIIAIERFVFTALLAGIMYPVAVFALIVAQIMVPSSDLPAQKLALLGIR